MGDVEPRRARPIRLLMVVDSMQVGGGERQVVDVAAALHGRGYEVTVACSADGMLSHVLEAAGVPARILMDRLVKRRISLGYAWKLRRLLREERFDLVHAHVYASVVASALATLGMGVPLVITQHSEGGWRGPRTRLIGGWAYRRAERVIAVSHGIRDTLVARDHVPAERIVLIPNGVPGTDGTTGMEPKLPEGPIVGMVSRLEPEKGVRVLLQAAPAILARFPACHMVVVGDGSLRGELEGRVAEIGLQDRVHFLGFQPRAPALMDRFDLLVLPSLSEGTPLVVLEAMAAGVPVVASDVGGIPGQIRNGQEGLLVPPGDPMALSQACIELLSDPGRARQLGANGRQRAASCFDHETMVHRIEAVYQAVLAGAAGRAEGAPSAARVD